MSILSGYNKYKRYLKTDDGYILCSQWTSSDAVEMNDGNTAETNLGAIKGLTSSLATDNGNYALSASAGKSLQDQVTQLNSNMGGLTFELITIKSQRNSVYTNLIQVYVSNIKGKKVFVTPSSNITLPSAISRINIYDNVLDIIFFSELAAETDYYFDLLIVSV